MTIEEIRKGAPFGSTHYDEEGNYYVVLYRTVAWVWDNNWKPVMFQVSDKIKPL